MHLGDYFSGCTIFFSFTTRRFSTGAPFTLAGTPNLLVRKNSAAQDHSCAALTLAVDCMSRTGLNTVEINTHLSPTFYSCGKDYSVEINVGTVDSVSVVGEVVAHFSLDNRSGLRPTIHGRLLDVTSTGAAGVDWGNVENPTTAVGLSCTTVYSAVKLVDRPFVDACSTVYSVTSVLNDIPGVTAGVTLSAAGVECVGFISLSEPADVPGWPMSLKTALGWLGALATNCVTQTAATQSLCTRALSSTIASAPITCSATIVHRGTFGAVIP